MIQLLKAEAVAARGTLLTHLPSPSTSPFRPPAAAQSTDETHWPSPAGAETRTAEADPVALSVKSTNWTTALFSETDSTRPAFPNAAAQEVKSSVSQEADTTLPHRTAPMWCPRSWREQTASSGEPAWVTLCPGSLCWLSPPPPQAF